MWDCKALGWMWRCRKGSRGGILCERPMASIGRINGNYSSGRSTDITLKSSPVVRMGHLSQTRYNGVPGHLNRIFASGEVGQPTATLLIGFLDLRSGQSLGARVERIHSLASSRSGLNPAGSSKTYSFSCSDIL